LGHVRSGDPEVHAIRHDVTNDEGKVRTAEQIDARFGRTHLLVNNVTVAVQARASTGTPKDGQ
jgi:NAD(P)-dependent dehydrogenase (short-subunit alcohol dehydrogenase family)